MLRIKEASHLQRRQRERFNSDDRIMVAIIFSQRMASGDLLGTSHKDHPLGKQPGWSLFLLGAITRYCFLAHQSYLVQLCLAMLPLSPDRHFSINFFLLSTPVLFLSFALTPFWPHFSKTLKHIVMGHTPHECFLLAGCKPALLFCSYCPPSPPVSGCPRQVGLQWPRPLAKSHIV